MNVSNKKRKDIRPDLNQAIIRYRKKTGRMFIQADIEPNVDPSHINNVASGRGTNHKLRTRILKFIEKHG